MIVIRLDQKALASLIEEEGEEFKLEITAATLEGAASRSLKTIVSKDIMTAFDKAVKEQIEGSVREEIGKITYGTGLTWHVKLSDRVRQTIVTRVNSESRKVINELASEEKVEELITGHVKAIASSAAYYVKRRLPKVLNAVIEEEVNRRVELALSMLGDEEGEEN